MSLYRGLGPCTGSLYGEVQYIYIISFLRTFGRKFNFLFWSYVVPTIRDAQNMFLVICLNLEELQMMVYANSFCLIFVV